MALIVDGTTIPATNTVKWNGNTVNKIIFDGVEVWHKQNKITLSLTCDFTAGSSYPGASCTVTLSRTIPFQWYIKLTGSATGYTTQEGQSATISGSTKSVSATTPIVIGSSNWSGNNTFVQKVYMYYRDPDTGTFKTPTYPGDPGVSVSFTTSGTQRKTQSGYSITYDA